MAVLFFFHAPVWEKVPDKEVWIFPRENFQQAACLALYLQSPAKKRGPVQPAASSDGDQLTGGLGVGGGGAEPTSGCRCGY